MLDDKSPCPSCGAHPMLTLRRQDGALEMRCGSCGIRLDVPAAPTNVSDLVSRVERLELSLRAAQGDLFDFSARMVDVVRRLEGLEEGKKE